MQQILIFISMIFILSSCQTKQSLQSDTFHVLLPDTLKTHRPNYEFDLLRNWGNQIKLSRIDTGVDKFELRLWSNGFFQPNYIIVLRKSDTISLAQQYEFYTNYDTLKNFELIKSYQNQSITYLVDSLQTIDFSKMISQAEIKGFNDGIGDGVSYYLEVATSKYYKLISYHCPGHYSETEINNKKFLDILLIINQSLQFYDPFTCEFKSNNYQYLEANRRL